VGDACGDERWRGDRGCSRARWGARRANRVARERSKKRGRGQEKTCGRALSAESKTVGAPQAEAALLERARSELGTNPTQALAATQDHVTRFPNGLLTQEREVITISALRRLGRTAKVAARAARFDKAYPNSAHQRVVDRPSAK
jgi:hypothetical protein